MSHSLAALSQSRQSLAVARGISTFSPEDLQGPSTAVFFMGRIGRIGRIGRRLYIGSLVSIAIRILAR